MRNVPMFVVLVCVALFRDTTSVEDLYLMALYPFHGAWYGGAAVLAASEMALEQVNEREDILPGYRLNLLWNDTGCDPGLGLDIMFKHLYSPPTKIMIIGALCSTVSQATAQVSYRWNVVQLSPVSSSPALSNKDRYKMFLRTNSPDSDINPARLEIFKEFQWSKIATIHQTFELFSVANDDLIKLMKDTGMVLVTSEIISIDPAIQVRKLKESGARIIVGSFYADMAVKVFCEITVQARSHRERPLTRTRGRSQWKLAYKIGLYGPKIAWVIVGWYSDKWWNATANVDCSLEQIEEVLDGYFAVDPIRVNHKPVMTIAGYTALEIQDMFWNKTNHEALPALNSGLQGFDAIWTAALALNKTMNDLQNNGSGGLETFTYDNEEMGQLLFNNAMQTEFPGVRGPISFNKNGDLNSIYRIDRFQGGKKQMVGLYYPKNKAGHKIEWLSETPIIWKGGGITKDSVTLIEFTQRLSPSLYMAMCVFSGFGVFLTGAFLAFNIGFRKTKIVKMSSPNLNNVTLAGCLILYSSVFLERTDLSSVVLCQAKLMALAVGFSLSFGALFAKTWRVYVIFTTGAKQKKVVKDAQLLLMVCVLVTINVGIIVIWFVIDPFKVVVRKLQPEINTADDIEIHKYLENCESPRQIYFVGTLFCMQGILLLFGVFLALQTRKITVDGLNDSKLIGVCIYNVVTLSVLGVMVSLTLKNDVDLNYGIISCIVMLATTVTQCLIFIPKIKGHFNQYRIGDVEPKIHTQITAEASKTEVIAA